MKKLYYDLDEDKYLTEREIRALSLREETNDILNNINDYLDNILSIASQTDFIKHCIFGDIEKLVDILNNSWGYHIQIQEVTMSDLFYRINGSHNLEYIDKQLDLIRELKKEEIKGEEK